MTPSRADRPIYKATPTATVAAHDWTGCYLGGSAGWGWTRTDWIDTPTGQNLGSHRADGWIGGGQAGCDVQSGKFLAGFEGMWDWAGIKGSHFDPNFWGADLATRINSVATLAGRLGLAEGDVLYYVKGGGAWIKESLEVQLSPIPIVGSNRRQGWMVGAGIERTRAQLVCEVRI